MKQQARKQSPARLGLKEHALVALRQAGHPLTARDLLDRMVVNGYRPSGKTPLSSISALPARTQSPDLFARPSNGMIGLREWARPGT
jgi:hypothetical protein